MRKIIVSMFLLTGLAFGQHFRGPRVVVRPAPIVVGGYWGSPYGWYGPYWGGPVVVTPPNPCKKEKLKDENGKKHEVLVCRQPDGTVTVVQPDGSVKK